jgi:dTDP-4-dehydrorhamnose reductase
MRTLAPLGPVIGIDYPGIDLANPDSIRREVDKCLPTAIINAAAYTAVDKAESEPERALAINGVAPGILAELARHHGAFLVHYSSDYVFDGMKQGPYTEADVANPLSVYGKSKLEGDRAVQAAGGGHLILRLCWVYGGRGRNFLRTILGLGTTRDELRVVNDQRGCPTWSRWIAEATGLAMSRVLNDDAPRFQGLYHLAAGGSTTWHGFAEAILDGIPAGSRACRRVVPVTTAEYPLPARRPANSVLDCTALKRVFGLELPAWQAGLEQVFETSVVGFEALSGKERGNAV